MDLFENLKKQNEEFRKDFNSFKGTSCCGGHPKIKKKKNKGYFYMPISQDDPINF